MVELLRPDPDVLAPEAIRLAPRSRSLEGGVVGIVNNSWRCMDIVTDIMRRELLEKLGVREVVEERLSATQRVSDERLDILAAKCVAVIVGIGNCGSCTAWSVHDSVELEARGIPTVTFCTEAYAELAGFVCAGKGLPDLHRVVMPHPLNDQPEDVIEAALRERLPSVLMALTGKELSVA